MPHVRSIHLGKEQGTNAHAQAITPFIYRLACLYHPRNGCCLVSDQPLHAATGNGYFSQVILPNNKLSRLTLKKDDFEDEQNHSSNHYDNKYHNGYGRISRVHLRKEAPETQQESTRADLARSDYSTYEQEHDNAESDCNQAQQAAEKAKREAANIDIEQDKRQEFQRGFDAGYDRGVQAVIRQLQAEGIIEPDEPGEAE